MDKNKANEAGQKIGILLFWWFMILFIGSITGIWIKYFWIGWVLK